MPAVVGSHAPRRELVARLAYGSAGERYRLGRMFGDDGRTLVVPVDHGLTLGPVEGTAESHCRRERLLMAPGLTRLTIDRFAPPGCAGSAPHPRRVLPRQWRAESGAALAATVEQTTALGVDCAMWNVSSRERAETAARIESPP